MEELESVLDSASNGTVVTSRYFLQPVEELAKKHGVRAVAVDLNDFRGELALLKELRQGSCEINTGNRHHWTTAGPLRPLTGFHHGRAQVQAAQKAATEAPLGS